MRATPRTWPSIRLRRASWDFLIRSSMLELYPGRVYLTSMTYDHCTHDHAVPETAIDPVCGMTVKVPGAGNTTVHGGHPYYFCSPKCVTKFSADPERYLKPAEALPLQTPVAAGTLYTCPMHPEVRQVGPGNCPICGMAL